MVVNIVRRRGGRVWGPFPERGKVEKRGGWGRRGVGGILSKEAIEGEANSLEGVKVGEMGISQGKALADGLVEQSTALTA